MIAALGCTVSAAPRVPLWSRWALSVEKTVVRPPWAGSVTGSVPPFMTTTTAPRRYAMTGPVRSHSIGRSACAASSRRARSRSRTRLAIESGSARCTATMSRSSRGPTGSQVRAAVVNPTPGPDAHGIGVRTRSRLNSGARLRTAKGSCYGRVPEAACQRQPWVDAIGAAPSGWPTSEGVCEPIELKRSGFGP